MRRNERAIENRGEIDAIIRACRVCRLGMTDGAQPYVVPLSFGYDGRALYFHCAPEGRKLELLRANPRVCVEFDLLDAIVESERGCGWGMRYRSVIGFGRAAFVEEADKEKALAIILAQYSERAFSFAPEMVRRTLLVRVDFDELTGKRSPKRE